MRNCPASPCFHLPKPQQKLRLCKKSAGHSWADVGLWNCHHHVGNPPRHHISICQDCSKSICCTTNLLDISERMSDAGAVTMGDCPRWQPCQLQHKEHADHVAATFGCWATAVRPSPSCSSERWRESCGSKRRPSDAASLRKRRSKARCAVFFKSATVPNCETSTGSRRPLGKDTPSTWKGHVKCDETVSHLTVHISLVAQTQRYIWRDSIPQTFSKDEYQHLFPPRSGWWERPWSEP